jgi:hypothetical protein
MSDAAELRLLRGSGPPAPSVDDMETCRDFLKAHAMVKYNPIGMETPEVGVRWDWRCVRCATERHDTRSHRDGGLLHRYYVWPDGYRKAKGAPKISQQEASMLFLERMKNDLKQNNAIAASAYESLQKRRKK